MREGGGSDCEWRKHGSVDDETGTCRSASHVFAADATCPYTSRDWEGVGGGTQSTSPGEGSHCKQSLMIKDFGTTPNFQINGEELNSCCEPFLDLRVSITVRERTYIFFHTLKTKILTS